MKLVYITSLAHSGSTVLNLSLGGHPRLVGLGEIHWMTTFSQEELEDEMRQACTCGSPAGECRFWAPVFMRILGNLSAGVEEKYRMIFEAFEMLYGTEAVIVDSSKRLANLRLLHAMPDVEVKALFMLKDVRGFTVSHRDSIPLEAQVGRIRVFSRNEALNGWIHKNSSRHPFYLFWKWYLRNRLYQRAFSLEDMDAYQLGYDEFAQHPADLLHGVCEFLGLDYYEDMLVPDAGENHNFLGNSMMFYPQKRASIQYDDRWQRRKDWRLAAALFPNIMAYNARQVYGHLSE